MPILDDYFVLLDYCVSAELDIGMFAQVSVIQRLHMSKICRQKLI